MFNKYDTVQITGHFSTHVMVGKVKTIRGLLCEFSHSEQLGFNCFENVSVLVSKKFHYNNFQIRQSFAGLCKIQLCRIVLVEKKIGPYWTVDI